MQKQTFRERCCDGPQKALAAILMPHVRLETVSTSELLLYGEAIAKLPQTSGEERSQNP